MTDHRRVQLDTKIEKEVHKMVQSISEGTYDKLQMYARRNNLPVDYAVLDQLLSAMKVVITEIEMNSMDSFHSNIKKELDTFTGEENPTLDQSLKAGGKEAQVITNQVAQIPQPIPVQQKKRKSVTLSI